MSLPSSWFLRWLMGNLLSAVILKVWHTCFYEAQTLEQAASSYVVGFLFTYLYGAVWSELTIVWVPACLLAAVFVGSLLWRGRAGKGLAQLALVVLALLSLFTIWLEPFVLVGVDTSVATVATIVIAELLGLFVVDVAATIAYAVILFIAWDAIDAEWRALDETAEPAESANEHLQVALAAQQFAVPATAAEEVVFEAEVVREPEFRRDNLPPVIAPRPAPCPALGLPPIRLPEASRS